MKVHGVCLTAAMLCVAALHVIGGCDRSAGKSGAGADGRSQLLVHRPHLGAEVAQARRRRPRATDEGGQGVPFLAQHLLVTR